MSSLESVPAGSFSLPAWDKDYPDPQKLRREAEIAGDAFVQALTEMVPDAELAAVYLKGSTVKVWTTPLDYVPALSDVDIHVLFADDTQADAYYRDVEQALRLAGRAEDIFLAATPQRLHVPRVQIVVANRLYRMPDFVPAPRETVRLIRGTYPPAPATGSGIPVLKEQLLQHAEYLERLGESVADLLGPHLRVALRAMSWRVSPAAPRVAELLGEPFVTVWSSNRTALVELLTQRGEAELAADYAAYYLQAWRYFLSGDQDSTAARAAIRAGVRVIERGAELAGTVQDQEPD